MRILLTHTSLGLFDKCCWEYEIRRTQRTGFLMEANWYPECATIYPQEPYNCDMTASWDGGRFCSRWCAHIYTHITHIHTHTYTHTGTSRTQLNCVIKIITHAHRPKQMTHKSSHTHTGPSKGAPPHLKSFIKQRIPALHLNSFIEQRISAPRLWTFVEQQSGLPTFRTERRAWITTQAQMNVHTGTPPWGFHWTAPWPPPHPGLQRIWWIGRIEAWSCPRAACTHKLVK